jgi:transcription initiation factor IIE alpha subunit
MSPLPPSSRTVLRALGKEGAMTHKDIVRKTHCNPRTVRYALKKLKENKLIIEKMNIRDMRQIIYQFRYVPLQETGMADS